MMALEYEQQPDDIANLLNALEKLEPKLTEKQTDIQYLKDFVSSNDFRTLLKAHNTVRIVDRPTTEHSTLLTSTRMVVYDLEENSSSQSEELLQLLSSTHVDSLVATYDKVANKEYPLQSVMAEEVINIDQQDDNNINTIRLMKGPREKLGATVKSDNVGNVLIGRIIHGTVADRCGLLHAGDVIHEINKIKLEGKTIDDVGNIMKSLEGIIEMKVSSEYSLLPQRKQQGVKYMKALFSYDPHDDAILPCEEVGLQFNERDIITVYNKDDPEWWQAKIEGDTKIGIIPSAKMRERMYYEEANQKQQLQRPSNRNKKAIIYTPLDCEELGGREVLSYEEVVKIQPQMLQPRPLVILAPKCQPYAMSDVKTKLIFTDHKRYAGPVPHTSRPPRTGERNGQQYHFLSKEEMRIKIMSNQFVEYGEQGGHYYGLSINTVRSIINQGKIGIMTIVPRALKIIHQSAELKPYVIFFGTPSDNDIHRYWLETELVQERDVPNIKHKTDTMISLYGQYFDTIVPYTNTDGAVINIQRITERLLQEPQWVPSTWIA